MTSRNDNHGENFFKRMQTSIDCLLIQLEKYKIDSELLLTDWNPPADKPRLKDAIKWPKNLNYCSVRIIEVDPSIHQRYLHSDKVPINMSVSLNCGFRRARGEFVVGVCADLLYSDELFEYIASKPFKEKERYRIDRCDVKKDVLNYNFNLKEQLEYCKNNIICIHSFKPEGRKDFPLELHTDAAGDFQLMSSKVWHLIRGQREADLGLSYIDGLTAYCAYAAGVKEVILKEPMRLYHIDHKDKCEDRLEEIGPAAERFLVFIFRKIKFAIPNFIKSRLVSFHHSFWSGKTKSKAYGVPTLDYVEYYNLCKEVANGRRPYCFNDENWGLGNENLPEFLVRKANWEKA